MAGLYNEFQGERRFVVLTTAANFSMKDIHDRMPVVLDADNRDRWLRKPQDTERLLESVPPELIKTPA